MHCVAADFACALCCLLASWLRQSWLSDFPRGLPAASCDTPLLLNRSAWYYDYNQADPYRKAGLGGDCGRANGTDGGRFVGMNWCLSSVEKPVPASVEQTYWMGFNEPNNAVRQRRFALRFHFPRL